MKVYVTGATGFVGSHVARELADQGATVRAERVELLDPAGLERAVEGCDAVVHVAALYSYDADPEMIERVNVEGTRNVLDACISKHVRRLVHTSTAGTCGPVPGREATELDSPPAWELRVPYKRTKLAAEQLVLDAARAGFDAVVVNPTTPVGEGDMKPTPTGRMIAGVASGAIRGYVATTGLNVVDVRDVARGHALALERGRRGERYLLGGVNLSLAELFGAVADLAGRPRPSPPYPVLGGRCGRSDRPRESRRGDSRPPADVFFLRQSAREAWLPARPRDARAGAGDRDGRGLGRRRKGRTMKFPLRSTVQIGRYVASQKGEERYPLVLMLEPTLGCNIACIGCGKIREYESNKARLTVEECLDSGAQCRAPVVSICGGEPLIYKGVEDVVAGFLEMRKNIQLCTNALRLEEMLDRFTPNPRLTWVIHLDGMREIHDYVCDYPGLWEIAIAAIKAARAAGFRVTTNTTIFKETEVDDVIEMMGYLTNEVGIDGMLVAPGYQYSQIDPNLTMTRAEHEEKFRAIRAAVRKSGFRWLASPVYQDFLTGERELPCTPWGSVTRNPYGWKGPCYLLTDAIFPTYEGLIDGMEWERYGPGNDPRCEHCGIHCGFEPSATLAATASLKETVRSLAWTLR